MEAVTTTPRAISNEIRTFCCEIVSTTRPEYIEVQPGDSSIDSECFFNVRDRVVSEGGSIEYGWVIWEWSEVLLEAEFHSIWQKADGARIDVTPKADGETRILFLPDPNQRFDFECRQRRDNVRKALAQDPDILEFIDLNQQLERVLQKSVVRPGVAGVDPREFLPLMERIAELENRLRGRSLGTLRGPKIGRNESCPCGSGRKYKKCCGARR